MRLRSSVVKRRTGLLFHWDHRDGFTRQGKPVTVDGIEGTFTRASVKRAVDSNGRVYVVPSGQPALHHKYNAGAWESSGVLLEKASTNLIVQSENFGTTWTLANTPTRTAAAHTSSGITLDLIGDDNGAGLEYYFQPIAFTGDAVKAVALYIKEGTSPPASGSEVVLTDATAVANRLDMVITWVASVPSVNAITGTHLYTERVKDGVFRLWFQTTAVTAANTNNLSVRPAFQSAEQGNLYAGGVQAEDALFPTSYIPTTTVAVTRAVDAMELPLLWTPKNCTVYVKHLELGTLLPASGVQSRLVHLGDNDSGTENTALIQKASASGGDVQCRYDTAVGTVYEEITSGALVMGDTQETRFPLAAASFVSGRSINGAAEVLGDASIPAGVTGLPSTWAEAVACFTSGGPFVGAHALQSVKIADGSTVGERTMAQMREAF